MADDESIQPKHVALNIFV